VNVETEYRKNVGHPPPRDESKQAWQWSYTGKRDEKELLASILESRSKDHGSWIVDHEQETLF